MRNGQNVWKSILLTLCAKVLVPQRTITGKYKDHVAELSADQIHHSPSAEYQKAIQLSLPIVQPQWVLACLIEKK